MEPVSPLHQLFRPRSIAVVGASTNPEKQGFRYVNCLLKFGFPGELYPVNPRGGELLGLKVYPSLREIPSTVDYVISTIPALALSQLVEECGQKGVKLIQLYSAHLGEKDTEGQELQKQVVGLARRLGIRVLGPNCMGLYYPEAGLTFRYGWPREAGHVAFISQSAGHTAEVVYRGTRRGLRFSQVISYGNAADIHETELLSYLGQDTKTQVIAAYIEGVRGKDFTRVLKEVAGKKPVLMLKGGRYAAGARAAFSHTGSLASREELWQALLRQCDALRVATVEEMVDTLLSFSFLPPPQGKNVAGVGAGGGVSILMADELEGQGFSVPPLPQGIAQEIKGFMGEDYVLVKNPVDTSVIFPGGWGRQELKYIFQLMAQHPQFNLLMVDQGDWLLDSPEEVMFFHSIIDLYLEVAKSQSKPVAFILRTAHCPEAWRWQTIIDGERKCIEAGFPVFPTLARAARALALWASYRRPNGLGS